MKPQQENPAFAYAIQAPSGAIMACTVSQTKGECWQLLWGQADDSFREKYWKRLSASMSAFRRSGYKCVAVFVALRLPNPRVDLAGASPAQVQRVVSQTEPQETKP